MAPYSLKVLEHCTCTHWCHARDLRCRYAKSATPTPMTEGSLATIRERYNILEEYALHAPDSDSLSSKVLLAQVANQKVWVSVNS
ncbi:hypothetical protein BHM03_00039823 [Ensete ventricosum]|nr:hypothetical protein BHM03_00039823 [Ensete ventricosum]